MRLFSIWLIALGFTTLVACGGAEVTVGDGGEKAEEPAKDADEKAEEPAEGEEKGEEEAPADGAPADGEAGDGEAGGGEAGGGDGAAPAPEMVCCEAKNKAGKTMKRLTRKGACNKLGGKALPEAECPAQ